MEVKKWFKGLDLKARVPEELQKEVHNIVQEAEIESSLRIWGKKSKRLSEEAL